MPKQPVRISIQASAKDRKTLKEMLNKIADEICQMTTNGSYNATPKLKEEQAMSGNVRTNEKSYRYRVQERKDKPAEVK